MKVPAKVLRKVREITDGWFNVAKDMLGDLEPEIKAMAEKRLKICENCPVRGEYTCDSEKCAPHVRTGVVKCGCSCPLIAKTKSRYSFCPLGKW